MSTDIQRQIKRKDQLDSGLFDGRYRQRVVVNKKKKQSRNWARKTKQYELLSNSCIRTTIKKRKYE